MRHDHRGGVGSQQRVREEGSADLGAEAQLPRLQDHVPLRPVLVVVHLAGSGHGAAGKQVIPYIPGTCAVLEQAAGPFFLTREAER